MYCIHTLFPYAVAFVLYPMNKVSAPGCRPHPFTCTSSYPLDDPLRSEWLVNGMPLNPNTTNPSVGFSRARSEGSLFFDNVPLRYNGTIIQCGVTFSSGRRAFSNNATLIIRGWPAYKSRNYYMNYNFY